MPGFFSENLIDHFNITEKMQEGLTDLLEESPTIGRLLLHLPIAYKSISKISTLSRVPPGSTVKIKITISSHSPSGRYNRRFGKKKVYQIFATTQDATPITLLFFKILPFQISKLAPKTTHTIEGKIEESMGQYRMTHPKIIAEINEGIEISTKINRPIEEDGENPALQEKENLNPDSKLEPLYRISKGITQDSLKTLIAQVITQSQKQISQKIDIFKIIDEKSSSLSLLDILSKIHHPKTIDDLEETKRATSLLSALEILSMKVALKAARQSGQQEKQPILAQNNNISQEISKRLGFELTDDQQRAISDIKLNQSSTKKMFRLLQGDVGSGKTAVAIMAMSHVLDAGGKAVFMAPTTILAQQHYRLITETTFGLNINTALLTGSTTAKERKRISTELKNNRIDILIGTHSLIQKNNEVGNFHLCIIDEQHRFGVQQRSLLLEQNPTADLLMMTATPIPRTILMMLFDDIQTSYLKNKPRNRAEIQTSCMSSAKHKELVDRLKLEIDKGKKVYWICPAVEESEENELGLISVQERLKDLQQNIGEERTILLHGKMKEKEKSAAMTKFANSSSKILVSTTVVEVGMDVPDATIIVVEQAERFGLSQLHQLRGRVGRGNQKSYCILLYSEKSQESSRKKLSVIKSTNDGFEIAEEDFRLRGSGDIIGTRQSGFENLRVPTSLTKTDSFSKIKDATSFITNNLNDPDVQDGVSLILDLFGYTTDIMKLINA